MSVKALSAAVVSILHRLKSKRLAAKAKRRTKRSKENGT